MLHILAWLAVLVAALFALGEVIRPWRKRRGFKLVFFPGVLLSMAVQVISARLCAEARIKRSPLGDGEAVFFMEKVDLPLAAGAVFVLISHVLLFGFFALTVLVFGGLFGLDSAAMQLPSLYPGHLSGNPAQVSGAGEASAIGAGFKLAPYVLLFYFFAPVFSNLRVRAREYLPAGLLVFALGWIYLGNVLGLEVKSQSWGERLFSFPPWWGVFSLYVLTALITLAAASVARALSLVASAPASRRRGGIKVKLAHVDGEPIPDETGGVDIVYE